MTRLEFMALCGEHLIDVDIALDSEEIQDALIDRDDERVLELIKSEF